MRIEDCCREIRLSAIRKLKRGDILEGINTNTNEIEKVIVVKPMEDYNKTVVINYSEKNLKKYIKLKKRLKE